MALSYTALFVLQALAQGYRFGFDVMDATRLPSGTSRRRGKTTGERGKRAGLDGGTTS
jgi:hypothetical protein